MSHTQQNELLVISKAYDHDKNYILHDFDSILNMQENYNGGRFVLFALGTIRIRTSTHSYLKSHHIISC